MRLVDITPIPDDQYLDFLRWFSMKNPDVTWYALFLDRLEKRGRTFEVGVLLKKLLVDPEGFEFLALYRNSMTCPIKDGMTRVSFVASYTRESRYEVEKTLAPDHVMVLRFSRVDEQGQRWLSREDVPLSSLQLEPTPIPTALDIQWNREETARREIEKATALIKQRWAHA